MNLVAVNVPGDRHVMSFVPFDGIGIFDFKNFLVAVGDDDCLGSGSNALLGAFLPSSLAPLTPHLESVIQPFTV